MSTVFSRVGTGHGVFSGKSGLSTYFTTSGNPPPPPPPPTPTYLLGQLSAPSVGAFSLRAVGGTSVLAVNVRRSTDNVKQDFYADLGSNLTTVSNQSLASWLGGATGYVATWYDQSGSNNHAVQTTNANQPVIQASTKGPGYMVSFNGTSQYVTLTSDGYSLLNGIDFTLNTVTQRTAAKSTINYVFGTNTQNGNFQNVGIGFDNDTTLSPLGNLTNTGGTQLTIAGYSGAGSARYITGTVIPTRAGYSNATLIGTNTNAGLLQVPSGGSYSIGYVRNGQNFFYYTGNVFELLVFGGGFDQTSVTTVYNNQFAVYGA